MADIKINLQKILTNVSHFMIHKYICFPDDKNNSHTNSNQVLVFWEDLNHQNYNYFKTCDDSQTSLMEEQAALLLWSTRPIKGFLGFEVLYKDRSTMIIGTADEDDMQPTSHEDDTDLVCARGGKRKNRNISAAAGAC